MKRTADEIAERVAWRICDMAEGPCLCRAVAEASGAGAVCDRFRLAAEAIVILVREGLSDETVIRPAAGPDAG